MYCIKCGAEMPKGARFCSNCGEIINKDIEYSKKEAVSDNSSDKSNHNLSDNRNKSIWVISAVSVLSLALILAVILLGPSVRRNIEGSWALAEIEGAQDRNHIEVPFFDNNYMTITPGNIISDLGWKPGDLIKLDIESSDFLIKIPKGHQEYTASWAGEYCYGEITEATEQNHMLWKNGDYYIAHKDGQYIEITHRGVVFRFAKKTN